MSENFLMASTVYRILTSMLVLIHTKILIGRHPVAFSIDLLPCYLKLVHLAVYFQRSMNMKSREKFYLSKIHILCSRNTLQE